MSASLRVSLRIRARLHGDTPQGQSASAPRSEPSGRDAVADCRHEDRKETRSRDALIMTFTIAARRARTDSAIERALPTARCRRSS